MKKNSSLAGKTKKKSIPININTNPMPGKIFISNPINPIASSYLSMGQKIQINKNLKNQKLIHVNTNSGVNYYTMNGKDSKQSNSSGTNSLFNNFHNNNSDINGINFNNYFNSNNNHSQHHYGVSNMDKNIIKYNNININTKARKHLSTISNSLISNELFINGYQTSKNNASSNLLNNNKPKSKIINTNSKNRVSRIRQTYSTRANFLDSRNKTKKVPMKSKLAQFKYQYRGKPVSTSFSNVRVTKNNFQGSVPRDIYNYIRADLLNNNTYENIKDNLFQKNIYTNGNFINNNLYELKSKHYRHNTASFDNRDIINIFNKKNLSNKSIKNINNININNLNNISVKTNNNNNVCINNIDSNNHNRNILNKNNNFNNEVITPSNQLMNKINNGNIRKKNHNQFEKGKINDIKIFINEKKFIQKENKNHNINNNKQNSYYTNININNIYHNYHSNNDNLLKDNYNNLVHHMKNSHSINMNIPGIKKISIKQKDKKNNMIHNQYKQINKPIPTPGQKIKNNIIPSQRNIKINLAKFLKDVKIKQNNKSIVGRKSLSIKRIAKENNSDFSLLQINDKFAQKILKNNEEGNDIGNCVVNNRQNINKTIQEEIRKVYIPEEKKNSELDNDNNNNNNILIDTNYISNMQNKGAINRTANIPLKLINEICQNNVNTGNNMKYHKINYNSNASTTNNNYYGNNKNDYSVDNIQDITNKDYSKNKENINELNLNNVTDIDKTNANKNDLSSNANDINDNLNKENLSNININNQKNYDLNADDGIISKNSNKSNINNDNNNDDDYKIETNKVANLDNNAIKTKLIENNISNDLFDEDNLNELPEDYDENFNDLYSIINKMNYGNVLVCVEGLFTPEGRTYKKYKDKFDKLYNKLFYKKGNSFTNSNNKPKKIMEGTSVASNAKTNSSSSKKNIINPMYNNELNLEKVLNAY